MAVKRTAPSRETVASVTKTIANRALAPLRSWLKKKGLPHSGKRDNFINLLARLIDSGELSASDLEKAVIGIEEAGGKRIFFFELQENQGVTLDAASVNARLRQQGIAVTDNRILAPNSTGRPKLVYAIVSGNKVRLKWVETHQEPQVDYFSDEVEWVNVRKIIVLEADLVKKQAQIRFDAPGKKHPHGQGTGPKTPDSYFTAYKQQAEAILAAVLTPTELRPALRSLLEAEPRVVWLRIENHTNERRTRVRYVARECDVRDDPEWKEPHRTAGTTWAFDSPAFDC